MRVDKIEKSKTKNNQTVYFIQGTASFYGDEKNRVPLITAIIIDGDQIFTWHSIYSGSDNNAEILEQIVETLEK